MNCPPSSLLREALADKVKDFTFSLVSLFSLSLRLFDIAAGMMADFYFDVFHNGRVGRRLAWLRVRKDSDLEHRIV